MFKSIYLIGIDVLEMIAKFFKGVKLEDGNVFIITLLLLDM